MPLFYATIMVRLDEENQQAANETARELAARINDESCTDCANVHSVVLANYQGPDPGPIPF